jgi:hypothetical protein
MEFLFGALGTQPPSVLIWGLVSRGIGLVYLIAFASLRPQVLPIAGRDGLLPIAEALQAERRDFDRRRWLYFPTLLWCNSSDVALRALVWLGLLASSSSLVGGPQAPWALGCCYLAYLSLDRALTLIYPWDGLLLEAGFWGALIPATKLLPQLDCISAPVAPVAWAFRLLTFRVLFGFGKHKFLGSTAQDHAFMRGFLATQPLPSYAGWFAQKLPLRLLKFSLYGLFVSEMIVPFGAFVPGPLASIAAVATIGLMLVIWLTGNYGHFNLVLIVVALSLFDHASARALTLHSLMTPVGIVFTIHTALALLALPFNTFSAYVWTNMSFWRRLRFPPLTWLVALARWLAPFRLIHPYGVFPPNSPPAARMTPVTEATWDGVSWHELSHRYWPTRETSAPRLCAPHHERFDQAVVYEGMGINEMSLFRGGTGRWDPYGHGGVSAPQRLIARMLAGTAPGDRFYDRSWERRLGAPQQVRVRTYMLEPASNAERIASGRWWRRSLIGPHFPPQRLSDMFVAHPLPPPELWHFEDVQWLYRSRLGGLLKRVASGDDPHRLIAIDAPELESHVLAQFWAELVPLVAARHQHDWSGLRRSVAELRSRYGRPRLHLFERIAGRYAAFLFAKLEPLWSDRGLAPLWDRATPTLDVPSLYELRLLTHQIVAAGKPAYDAVIAEPLAAREHAARSTMYNGQIFHALFRYETLVYQSQKLRLIDAFTQIGGRRALNSRQLAARERFEAVARRTFGALSVVEFLKTQFTGEEDRLDIPERWPHFEFTSDDEVVRCAGEHASNTASQRAEHDDMPTEGASEKS